MNENNFDAQHSLNSVDSRTYGNPLFSLYLLSASVVTAILSVVFLILFLKDTNEFGVVSKFLILFIIMAAGTVCALGTGLFFLLKRRRYNEHSALILSGGANLKAEITDVTEKQVKTREKTTTYYSIKFTFSYNGTKTEAQTDYIFYESEVEYFRKLNFFPVCYNKNLNQYLYYLYVAEQPE